MGAARATLPAADGYSSGYEQLVLPECDLDGVAAVWHCCAGWGRWRAGRAGSGGWAQAGQAQRVVQGKVVDKGGAGLKGATVYLKDGHTLAVKSYVATRRWLVPLWATGAEHRLPAVGGAGRQEERGEEHQLVRHAEGVQYHLKIDTSRRPSYRCWVLGVDAVAVAGWVAGDQEADRGMCCD